MSLRKAAPWTVELQKQGETAGELIARCWREDAALAAIEHVDIQDDETLTLRERLICLILRGACAAGHPMPKILPVPSFSHFSDPLACPGGRVCKCY